MEGVRLDTKDKVLTFLAEIEAERAAGVTAEDLYERYRGSPPSEALYPARSTTSYHAPKSPLDNPRSIVRGVRVGSVDPAVMAPQRCVRN
jgi:hypothetical protein